MCIFYLGVFFQKQEIGEDQFYIDALHRKHFLLESANLHNCFNINCYKPIDLALIWFQSIKTYAGKQTDVIKHAQPSQIFVVK